MKKYYLKIIGVIIIAVVFNLLMHTYNNQYKHNDIQGAYGVVDYSKSQQDVHFLTEGWQLYLNADHIDDIQKQTPDRISGVYSSLDVDKAIYRIQILNDNPKAFYTFVMPEIFSRYELYINNNLIHSQDYIQYTNITISGEQALDCVLIIQNDNHYYSGQIFPIAFGESNAISTMISFQNYSHAFLILIAVISIFIMFTIYIFTGKEKKYLYALILSILLTGYLSHYFIHQFIPVYTVLSYLSEDLCYYLTLFILFLFINQFYNQILVKVNKKILFGLSISIVILCILPYFLSSHSHLLYYTGFFLKIEILLLLIYTILKRKESTLIYPFIIFFVISYCFDFLYNFEPIYVGWGTEIATILLLIAYNIDIIKRQIQLYNVYHQLKAKEALMIEFAHTKAHDLKAPVATMKGYVELLHDNGNNQETVHILEKLDEKIATITFRMNQLQNLEYETVVLNKKPTDLYILLQTISQEFIIHATKKQKILKKSFIDISYTLDPHYFKIVIENLIMNAIEHAVQEKIQVKSYLEKDNLVIEIQNFGDIITDKQKKHIFDQGFSTKGSNRGYGLYISQKIIQASGGTIKIISNHDEGTRFLIILPLKK